MPTSIPTVFIPALLCDERLYNAVIASLGDQIKAQVVMSPKSWLADSVTDISALTPAKFALAVHLTAATLRWQHRSGSPRCS